MHICYFFLDPGGIKSCLGAIWNFSKEEVSPELISDYGAQKGPFIRPRSIGTGRARTQMLNNQLKRTKGTHLSLRPRISSYSFAEASHVQRHVPKSETG